MLLVGGMHRRGAAQMPLVLGGLLGEDMALERLRALDRAAGAHLEALGGATLGLQLGHCLTPSFDMATGGSCGALANLGTTCFESVIASPYGEAAGFDSFFGSFGSFASFFAAFLISFFPFFGASTMINCRPSILGNCSTSAYGSRSCLTRSIRRTPNSWCAISRPRYRSVTFALSPSSRNLIRLRSLIW